MRARDVKAPAGSHQTTEGIEHSDAATNVRTPCGADKAKLWKRSNSENKARTQHDIDGIGQPEHPHGDGRVSGSTESCIDQKEHDDSGIAREHDPRESNAVLHAPW